MDDRYLRALRALMIWGFAIGLVLLLATWVLNDPSRNESDPIAGLLLLFLGVAVTSLAMIALMVWLVGKSIATGHREILDALGSPGPDRAQRASAVNIPGPEPDQH